MSDEQRVSVTGKTNNVTIVIDELFCKGCTICVEVCPKDTLIMVPIGTRWQGTIAAVDDVETCTACMLCEIQCPDFAIEIHSEKKAKKTATA